MNCGLRKVEILMQTIDWIGAECDECGMQGLDPEEDMCGQWIGTPENGFPCPDIICPDCVEEDENNAN